MAVSTLAGSIKPESTPTLDATHRCDKCGAQAYVRLILTTGYDLLFCAHDYHAVEKAVEPFVDTKIDERHRLVQNKLQGSEN